MGQPRRSGPTRVNVEPYVRLPLHHLCPSLLPWELAVGISGVVLGEVVLMDWGANRALWFWPPAGESFTWTLMDASYCFNLQGLDGRWPQLPERLLEHLY